MRKFFISIMCVVVVCVITFCIYEKQTDSHSHGALNCQLTQEEVEKIAKIEAEEKFDILLSDYNYVDSWHDPYESEWIVLWSEEYNSVGGGVAIIVDCESKHITSVEPQA